MIQNKIQKMKERLPDFDAELSPDNISNIGAARARGLVYNPEQRDYADRDGCLIRDKYGQRF
jgi:hypothetical protein